MNHETWCEKMSKESKTEPSIIDIIQTMVKEGESEETILETLKSLGVEPQKAQRLLLLGQADTFALLRNEISKIVKSDIEKEKPELQHFIEQRAVESVIQAKQNLELQIREDLGKYEKQITGQSKTFQQEMSETVSTFAELSERVRGQMNELGARVEQVRLDMDELKVRGIGTRNKWIGNTMLALGLLFIVADLYVFATQLGGSTTIDTIVLFVVTAIIGITLVFLATLI
ncbi:MAG: hypothetical protein HY393_03895 [Candidatus Diapherotrites archaeon]|nr:hypothetical protein [Candidatus Diapherotrites archaeon]